MAVKNLTIEYKTEAHTHLATEYVWPDEPFILPNIGDEVCPESEPKKVIRRRYLPGSRIWIIICQVS